MIQQILIGIAWANGLFLALWAIGALGCMVLNKKVCHKHFRVPNPFLSAVVGFFLLGFGCAFKTGWNTVLWMFPLFCFKIDYKPRGKLSQLGVGIMRESAYFKNFKERSWWN